MGEARHAKGPAQDAKEARSRWRQTLPSHPRPTPPSVTTSPPVLSVVCQYPLPEESLKDRMLTLAATVYFINVKTNFTKKPHFYFVLSMARFLRETAFLDPQEVKASFRSRVAVETFDL